MNMDSILIDLHQYSWFLPQDKMAQFIVEILKIIELIT